MAELKKVLFVCLGNICRSPLAEAVFLHVIEEKGLSSKWEVDSAAIGPYHIGKSPDQRALKVMKNHNLKYDNKARQITREDFNTYDYIFGMDDENISDLNSKASKNCKAKIALLGDFDPNGEKIIRDPYYDSGIQGFEKCYEQCLRSCTAFLEQCE